jgi:hypothetical protein
LRPGSTTDRIKGWLARNGWLIGVITLALVVRLVWNLEVHPLGDFLFSDMAGYDDRATRLVEEMRQPGDWKKNPYDAFFPYGTHYLVGLIKLGFGVESYRAIGVAYAILGAGVAGFTYATAARLSRYPWVPRIAGVVVAIHYVHISLGSYVLSEIPAAFCISAVAWLTVRLAGEGKARDAWLLGLVFGVGAAIRPQILMVLPVFAVFWVWRRRQLRGIRLGHLARAAIPLALILAFSAKRVHHHTGKWMGLVSTNGPLNYTFGRCHNASMESYTGRKPGTGERMLFGPPSLNLLRKREKKNPDTWMKLDPAMSYHLKFRGRMWDKEPLAKLADECTAKTGWSGQLRYAATHVVLLWGYNITWPDVMRMKYREYTRFTYDLNLVLLTPSAIFAMFLTFRRRWASFGLLTVHLWALTLVAILYFGDTRFRAPYDGLIVVLVAHVLVHYGRQRIGWLTTLPSRWISGRRAVTRG